MIIGGTCDTPIVGAIDKNGKYLDIILTEGFEISSSNNIIYEKG